MLKPQSQTNHPKDMITAFNLDSELALPAFDRTPERSLLEAILERTIRDLEGRRKSNMKNIVEAIDWIEKSIHRDDCFSFNEVMNELQFTDRGRSYIAFQVEQAKKYVERTKYGKDTSADRTDVQAERVPSGERTSEVSKRQGVPVGKEDPAILWSGWYFRHPCGRTAVLAHRVERDKKSRPRKERAKKVVVQNSLRQTINGLPCNFEQS